MVGACVWGSRLAAEGAHARNTIMMEEEENTRPFPTPTLRQMRSALLLSRHTTRPPGRPPVRCVAMSASPTPRRRHPRLDSHVHVWGPPDGHTATMLGSSPGQPLPPGDPGLLLAALDATDVSVAGAVIVQPACYGFDHSYLEGVIKTSNGRFVGCALADPTAPSPAAAAATTAALLDSGAFTSIRFNPYLWPEGGSDMGNAIGVAMAAEAGKRGSPVCVMAFKGLTPLIPALRSLLTACPDTPFVLDHVGFAGVGKSEDIAALHALATDFPATTHVKASALFRLGGGAWPHEAAVQGPVKSALAAFGPTRILAGTDWPWVTEMCSYADAWAALDGVWEGWTGDEDSLVAARAAVEGGNAARLFKWKGGET